MKPLHLINYLIFTLILGFIFSCEKNKIELNQGKGSLEFTLNVPSEIMQKSLKSAPINENNINSVVISITNADSVSIYDKKKIELFNMNGYYISSPLSLTTGSYFLTEFFVTDSANNVLYLTPKTGSPKASLVDNPLPIQFNIKKDEVNKLTLEVLSAENSTPSDFGYATFSFNIIETLDFLLSVFIYNDTIKNFQLTDVSLTISDSGSTLLTRNLQPITNSISIKNNYNSYILNIKKTGYFSYNHTFSSDSLKLFNGIESGPLMVILKKYDETVLKGPVVVWWDGKDKELFGFFNPDEGSIYTVGTVGDLRMWNSSMPCTVIDGKLIAYGIPPDGVYCREKIYICDLYNGTLLKTLNWNGNGFTIAGSYKKNIVIVWHNDKVEKYGIINLENGDLETIGTVGDMRWWTGSMPCKVFGDKLIVIGVPGEDADWENQKIYICDMQSDSLIKTIAIDKKNISIAGFYNEKMVLVWWSGEEEKFGLVDLDNETLEIIGTVGDMKWWNVSGPCTVFDDKLIVIGLPDDSNGVLNQKYYVCDLKTGNLIKTGPLPNNNITFAN